MIKACDRLDNLRSLNQTSAEFQAKQIKETTDKYLPLFYDVLLRTNPIVRKISEITLAYKIERMQ